MEIRPSVPKMKSVLADSILNFPDRRKFVPINQTQTNSLPNFAEQEAEQSQQDWQDCLHWSSSQDVIPVKSHTSGPNGAHALRLGIAEGLPG